MKLWDAVQAFKAAEKLSAMSTTNWTLARKIYLLKEGLRPAIDFYAQEENKIYANHPNLNPSTGIVTVPGGTNADARMEVQEIDDQFRDLQNSYWEFPEQGKFVEIICVDPSDFDRSGMSGDMIGALMPFIIFRDEDEKNGGDAA